MAAGAVTEHGLWSSLLGLTSLTYPPLAVLPWACSLTSLGIWVLLVNQAIITLPLRAVLRIK